MAAYYNGDRGIIIIIHVHVHVYFISRAHVFCVCFLQNNTCSIIHTQHKRKKMGSVGAKEELKIND